MRRDLRAFTVNLEAPLAERVEKHAAVFSSSSAFLRLAVTVFFRMVDAGKIKLEAAWLQETLQENSDNERNRVADGVPQAARPGAAEGQIPNLARLSQRDSLTRRDAAATEERARQSRSSQPLRFANINFAWGARILQ